MKTKLHLVLLGLLLSLTSYSQTLSAGDIAFIGYNTDSPDAYSFITLTDIPGSESIYFTDQGIIDANNWLLNGEDHWRFDAPAGGISCGTVINIQDTGTGVTISGVTGASMTWLQGTTTNNLNLSAGDQMIAYQVATPGVPASPNTATFIAGIHGDDGAGSCLDPVTGWSQSACVTATSESIVPPGLTNGTDCIALFPATGTEQDNARYNGTLTGTSTVLRALINDRTNWTFDNGVPFDISPSFFSPNVTCVAACNDPDVPTVTATPNPVCEGATTTLNISGNLNDATEWAIYTGSCGSTAIGTTSGSTFVVTPTAPSTEYFVRGEGGCVTPGSCGFVTVTVNALDDASFNYSASSYCVSDPDPTPTITGLGGGSFTSSPPGLSLNGGTGAIDVSLSTPNTYTVTYTTVGACPNSSNVNVTINGLDDPSFSYSAASYCVDSSDPTPTITGLGGGSFTSSPPGLSINGGTGAIDVSLSTPNTYTVTYTTTGSCPNSSNLAVTINALDDASFNYSAASYCVDASDPTPTITGLVGGTFSSVPAGLNLNTTTGQIDVSLSTPGTYTVTYLTAGACPNSSNLAVTINSLSIPTFTTLSDICVDAGVQAGLGGGTPMGGVYSGPGVTDDGNGMTYTFDPATAGISTHTISYTAPGTCAGSATDLVEVFSLPTVTFTALSDLAVDSGIQAGLGGGSPVGGVYSGPGITDDGNGMTYSFDPAVAGVNVHTISYIFTNANGCSGTATDQVEVTAPLSIDDNILNRYTKLYPNPNQGIFTLDYSGEDNLKELTITDITGKQVQTISLKNFSTSENFNLSNLSSGMYFIRIQSETSSLTKRIIIE